MVDESIENQISEKRRATMDALTKADLIYEIERGKDSRFGPKCTPYLKLLLAQIESGEKAGERTEDVSLVKKALWLSVAALIISIIAIVVSVTAT